MKKTCSKCGEEKSLESFYADKSKTLGKSSRCKSCSREYQREWNSANDGYMLKYSRKWYEENAGLFKKYYKRWLTKFPEKRLASNAVYKSLRLGDLTRQPCEVCGEKNSEGHHPSYDNDKRLDVIWLCRLHHKKEHARINKETRALLEGLSHEN